VQIGGLLYVVRNVVCSAESFPVGTQANRLGHQRVLIGGYILGTIVTLGVLSPFAFSLASAPYWAIRFAGAGLVIATQDALESTVTAEPIPTTVRGTVFGVLGTVNGVGDLASSVLVGVPWTAMSPVVGFGYAAVAMA
jgi:hypothetical protein